MRNTISAEWTARPGARDGALRPKPRVSMAMWRGAGGRCPNCGVGPLFAGWLRVTQCCPVCSASLGSIQADDAPPYFVLIIVAHIMVGAMFAVDRSGMLSVAAEMMIFLPATVLLSLVLIRPVKGAIMGLMLALGMMRTDDAG